MPAVDSSAAKPPQRGSYLPKVESPGAAAPTANFGSVSVWGWKRVGSSAELNTFLLLVSPLQCLGTPVVVRAT